MQRVHVTCSPCVSRLGLTDLEGRQAEKNRIEDVPMEFVEEPVFKEPMLLYSTVVSLCFLCQLGCSFTTPRHPNLKRKTQTGSDQPRSDKSLAILQQVEVKSLEIGHLKLNNC